MNKEMELNGEMITEDETNISVLPSVADFVNEIADERVRDILHYRLNGETLQEIGTRFCITRERVRQICKTALVPEKRHGRNFREDKYISLFYEYEISRDDFTFAFDEPASTYEYLDMVTAKNPSPKKPLVLALEDENIPVSIRRQAERAVYRYYISINGRRILKNRNSLVNYYVRTHCRKLTRIDDFIAGYHEFLDELGLADDVKLKVKGREAHAYDNYLNDSLQNHILWNQWRSFRYYDIESRDYGAFLEAVNLRQYNGMEISALKIFRDNAGLMQEYDIRDEYELHNLLRKIYDDPECPAAFRRMPTIEVGHVDRDSQVMSLLLQYSPVTSDRLCELYEAAYGVKAPTVKANYLMNFGRYLFNGVYSVNAQNLPDNEFSALSESLTEDYYTVEDVKGIYLREFPGSDVSQINPYTLKTLGFNVYSGYVVRNTYAGASDYFDFLLAGNDIADVNELPKSIQNEHLFRSELQRLRQEREIVEFGHNQYISIGKLSQFGATKKVMDDYCRAVNQFAGENAFFTVKSIAADGFSHPLDDLGFDEIFYSAVLMEDRERFTCQRLGGTRIFINGESGNIIAGMFLSLLGESSKIDIYDLRDILEDRYGVVLDKWKLIDLVRRDTDMYYDAIMEAVYIDYETYFEEI